jgi:hypothetical protein
LYTLHQKINGTLYFSHARVRARMEENATGSPRKGMPGTLYFTSTQIKDVPIEIERSYDKSSLNPDLDFLTNMQKTQSYMPGIRAILIS